jgi:hypothetical protein
MNYSIIDIYGRKVIENTLSPYQFVDISSLAEGVYFVRINNESIISTSKFIKVN